MGVQQHDKFIQLPLPTGQLVWHPRRKRRKEDMPQVPLWLEQINRTNAHPLRGTALGTGAKPTVPQIGQKSKSAAWPPPPGTEEGMKVEDAKACIRNTFGMTMVEQEQLKKQEIRGAEIRESLTNKIQSQVRSQELEFIKRSRESL